MSKRTKNVQVIDGAMNCAYDVFPASEADFAVLFPDGQDVEFIEDFWRRVGAKKAGEIIGRLYEKRADKKKIHGIHGTLFYQLEFKKQFYPTKREADLDVAHSRGQETSASASSKRGRSRGPRPLRG